MGSLPTPAQALAVSEQNLADLDSALSEIHDGMEAELKALEDAPNLEDEGKKMGNPKEVGLLCTTLFHCQRLDRAIECSYDMRNASVTFEFMCVKSSTQVSHC